MKPIFIQGRDLLFGGALSLAAIVFGTQAGSLVYSHTHGNETIGGNRLANTQLAMNQDWPEIAPELVFMNTKFTK